MKYKVLYVDDEEINLQLFKNCFRRDFNVITAISAFDALNILENSLVDVVVTDQRMPLMTGVELLQKINLRFPSIPPHRLIVSGFSENADIKKAYKEYKLTKFISKPWNYDEMKEIICECIEKKY